MPLKINPKTLGSKAEMLEWRLQSRVVGQDRAIHQFVKAMQKYYVHMMSPNRPIATLLFMGPTGVGKCLAAGTKILMFDGSSKMVENVVSGDQLMGPDSKPRTIKSVTSGIDEMFEIIPVKGESHTVNKSHIMSVKMTYDLKSCDAGTIVNISVEEYLQKSKYFKHRAKLYRAPVDFAAQVVPIDPYFIGLWLGDGHSITPAITTGDAEIKQYIQDFAFSEGLFVKEDAGQGCSTFYINTGPAFLGCKRSGRNRLLYKMKGLGILNNKHVPLEYKANSQNVRLQVLAGLLDSDGSLTAGGTFDFISVNETLADDVAYLSRSLGLAAYITACVKKSQNGAAGNYFRVSISGPISIIPCKVARKKPQLRLQNKDPKVTGIRAVTYKGVGKYFGFTLDGDGLFLLGDFTVTHNTELVHALAETLLDNRNYVTRVDCAEFKHGHETAKLLGSPPGYVGYKENDTARLSQQKIDQWSAKRNPENTMVTEIRPSIVLFDEIEKAHEDLFDMLLGILDTGKLTLGNGQVTDFTKTILVMTSNLGSKAVRSVMRGHEMGFHAGSMTKDLDQKIYDTSKQAAQKYFKPEFMNRVDRIVVFRALDRESLKRICQLEFLKIKRRVNTGTRFMEMRITPEAVEFILDEGVSEEYGARELKRVMERFIAEPISNLIASNQLIVGDCLTIGFDGKEIIFEKTHDPIIYKPGLLTELLTK